MKENSTREKNMMEKKNKEICIGARLTPESYEKLKILAALERRSISNFIRYLIEKNIEMDYLNTEKLASSKNN